MQNLLYKIVIGFTLVVVPIAIAAQSHITRKTTVPPTAKTQTKTQKTKTTSTARRRPSPLVSSAKYLRVDGHSSDISYRVSPDAGSYSYDVDCNTNYEVSLLPTWCTLSSKKSNQFIIYQEANNTSSERSDWFRVSTKDGKKIDISLTQPAVDNSEYGYDGTTRENTNVAKALPSLTNAIKEWGSCKSGSITEGGAGIVLSGRNGYSYASIPTSMADKIKELNGDAKLINDVALSDSKYWCIIFNDNDWYGVVPDNMAKQLNSFRSDGDKIFSISINSGGDFTIVSDNHYYASNASDNENMKRAKEKYGHIYSACSTPKGLVVCCESGCYYRNIPTNVETKIKEVSFVPKHVKFTDCGTCLLTDGDKRYDFYM